MGARWVVLSLSERVTEIVYKVVSVPDRKLARLILCTTLARWKGDLVFTWKVERCVGECSTWLLEVGVGTVPLSKTVS